MVKKSIGERIKDLRKTNNLTQKGLGEILHISEQAVSKWERNEALPDIDKITVLSKTFSVTCDFLLNGQEVEKVVDESIWEQIVKLNKVVRVKELLESSYLKDNPINILETKDIYGNYFIHYVLDYDNYDMLKLVLDDQIKRLNILYGSADYTKGDLSYWTIKKMHYHILSKSDAVTYKYIDSTKGPLSMSKALAISIQNNDLYMLNELLNIYMNTARGKIKDQILLDENIKKAILNYHIEIDVFNRIGIRKWNYETIKGYESKRIPSNLIEYLTYIVENNGRFNHEVLVNLIMNGEHDYTYEKNENSGYIKKVYELSKLDRDFDLGRLLKNIICVSEDGNLE